MHEVTHPLAEHLLMLYPASNSTAAASALLAAVETQQIDAVRLVLNHIAVRKEQPTEMPLKVVHLV